MSIDIFKNYRYTASELAKANLAQIVLQAYWDTYSLSVWYPPKTIPDNNDIHSSGRSGGDLAAYTYINRKEKGHEIFNAKYLTASSMGKAFVGLRHKKLLKSSTENVEQEYQYYNNPIRVLARGLWDIVKVPELIVNILDYSVEALLYKSVNAVSELDPRENSFNILPLIFLLPMTIALFSAHIALKIVAVCMRLVFSSSNAWKEADAIDYRLGIAARVATLALTVGLCFAVPALAPYLLYIHAPLILSAIAPIAIYLAGSLPFAIPTGLAILTGTLQAGKMLSHQFSDIFNSWLSIKSKPLERWSRPVLPKLLHDGMFVNVPLCVKQFSESVLPASFVSWLYPGNITDRASEHFNVYELPNNAASIVNDASEGRNNSSNNNDSSVLAENQTHHDRGFEPGTSSDAASLVNDDDEAFIYSDDESDNEYSSSRNSFLDANDFGSYELRLDSNNFNSRKISADGRSDVDLVNRSSSTSPPPGQQARSPLGSTTSLNFVGDATLSTVSVTLDKASKSDAATR